MDERHARLVDKFRQAVMTGNTGSAELTLNKLVRCFPTARQNVIFSAELAFLKGDLVTGTEQLTALSMDDTLELLQLQQLAETLNKFELYFPLYKVLARIFEQTGDAKTRYFLGVIAMKTGRVEEAFKHLGASVTDPAPPELPLHLGHACKALSQTDEAVAYYHNYVDRQPDSAGTGYWSLADLKDYEFTHADLEKIEQALATCADNEQRGLLWLARARADEQHNKFDQAENVLIKGNQALAQQRGFNAAAFSTLIDKLTRWSPEAGADTKNFSAKPVFVVGLPRSGTTLTEQILASHSNIEATDELPYLERVALQIQKMGGYPEAVNHLTHTETSRLRSFYLHQAQQYAPGSDKWFIDKNPNNFLHVGLIMRLFPEAKIVNIMRPVLDNAVSLLRQHFSKGNDYAYSVEHILNYMQGYYRLTEHWKKCFGNKVLHLDYEQLVRHPEPTISNLLSYCGVKDEAQCHTFYLSTRPVLTPSAAQVRKPISDKSLGSGKKYSALFSRHQTQIASLTELRAEILR